MSFNKHVLLTFLAFRLLLTLWAIVALLAVPLPEEPDEVLRPYLGQPILSDGITGRLLGPWQRFDTLHYTRIAAQGYADESDSVFPPLYPLLIRFVSAPFGNSHASHLAAAILISNVAALALFALIFGRVNGAFHNPSLAIRTIVYLALFPAGFFLFAPYTESLFILLAAGSVIEANNGRFLPAGLLGFFAALTRLTGAVLVAPLLLAWWLQRIGPIGSLSQAPGTLRNTTWRRWAEALPLLLPGVATGVFLLYRRMVGQRPLSQIYRDYWYQTSGLPGQDVLTALHSLFGSGTARPGEFTLWFDLFALLFMVSTTWLVFQRLGAVWGTYNLVLILFVLLPTSDLKPLYSFSRYTLALVPSFVVLAQLGERPWVNRIVLYLSLPLYLYFAGQFFIWGWVA